MSDFVVHIYRFFRERILFFYILLAAVSIAIALLASQIRFEENISGSIPKHGENDLTGYVVANLSQTDKIIVDISLKDTSSQADPEALIDYGQALFDSLQTRFDTAFIKFVLFKASEENMQMMIDLALDHLPLFMEESDYLQIDSLLSPEKVDRSMGNNYKILSSPASMVLKNRIARDPLGISNLALVKLKSLRAGDNFELYDGCVFTNDMQHLLIFIEPAHPSSETAANSELIDGLDELISSMDISTGQAFETRYFGGAAVAVANARQIKRDIAITLIISFGLIFLLVGWYFKDFRARLLGLLPAVFGAGLALAMLYLFKGHISAISLGIGSVILGLIVDYAMYFMNNYRKSGDIEAAIRDMTYVILLCAVTTSGALLCLTFLDSTVLRDLGWFATLSVVGAAFFTLIILPQFVHFVSLKQPEIKSGNFIDRLGSYPYHEKKWLLAVIVAMAVISLFYAGKASFEMNMNALNFMTPSLKKAETELDRISNYKLKNVFIVAVGPSAESALRSHDRLVSKIRSLVKDSVIRGVSDAGPLLTSDSLQQVRILRWNSYWNKEKKERVNKLIVDAAKKAGFSEAAFQPFQDYLNIDFQTIPLNELDLAKNHLVSNWITYKPGMVLMPTILKVKEEDKGALYQAFRDNGDYVIYDKQSLIEKFVEGVKSDFDRLVMLSMIFVTLLLIFSYGRLGLGLITALPMFGSWLITLGFMGLTGNTFNIFNIILSSFIFGLGVDHSILIMRGMQRSLKYGTDELPSYRVSVILSSGATLFGAGALFLARHPALHSIALISLVGMITVVILSFTIQPWLVSKLILERSRQHKFPVTLRIVIKTFITWGNIVAIALILMILGGMINLQLPMKRKKKELLFHHLFYWLTKAYIAFTFAFDRKLINEHNENFTKPAIIISNHQSLIETPAFLRLYPKIIILTTSWVYKSPIFGPIARLANFYNVDDGIENILGLLKEKVNEGFSILIFPEAHRSYEQRIQRFHRGAFFLAEKLQVDILPIVVFGTGDFLGKGAFWGRPNSFRMKILKRVPVDDHSFGKTYQERTRQFRQYYIREYARFKSEEGDAHYYRRKLALNYTLKGPILEWYMRIKLKLEDDYEIYNRLMPREGEILDLGCGYGFISYMLMFTGDGRRITGVDYDSEKIAVAANCFSKNDRVSFVCADVSDYEITPMNGFILSDVLHYLTPGKQELLLKKCFSSLLPGGIVLIREANAELEKRHKKSLVTEFLSTRIGFNKTQSTDKQLYFTSAETIRAIAFEHGLSMEVIDNKKVTSNNLFVLKKSQIRHA
jgi:1-acyl-sn-glycerol-3-phosphate acyltransferase